LPSQLMRDAQRRSWDATDNGVRFQLWAPTGELGDYLLENTAYRLRVNSPQALENPILKVAGLAMPSVRRYGAELLADLSIGSEYGTLALELFDGGRYIAAVTTTVRPKYLDPTTDFASLQEDLRRISYSLAYTFWRQTFYRYYPSGAARPGLPEWLAMLRSQWSRLLAALSAIERDPNKELIRDEEIVSTNRPVAIDREGLRWLARRTDAWEVGPWDEPIFYLEVDGKRVTPSRLLNTRPHVTYDTPANRALKAEILRLERRLASGVRAVAHIKGGHFATGQLPEYHRQLTRMLIGTRRILRTDFMQEAGLTPTVRHTQIHITQTDPRYRTAFRLLDLLKWSLIQEVRGSAVDVPLKDTWLLYEYWVYLYVVELMSRLGWECTSQGLVAVQSDGALTVDIGRGDRYVIQFEMEKPTARIARLVFHKTFPVLKPAAVGIGSLTIERDPDIFIEVTGGGVHLRLVLDPKYRREVTRGGFYVCPAAAVDDMHTYRDSIGRWNVLPGTVTEFDRVLDTAVAVFPAPDQPEFLEHPFFRSLVQGVGALPLMPNTVAECSFDKWLQEHVAD